ncbi:hypothetical protein ACH5RR_016837 [Cinchona calisaya]|uniref:Pollen Ole e 1 allergen and extensin family protein n=1 Tax=Cinchona calisaya TaxID=153742 RepID=A0ABD2ZYB8_9GENT
MASSQLKFLTSLLLLSWAYASTSANQQGPVEKQVEVGIEGVVYCQSCERYGTWSFSGAKPISNATISVICKNYKDRVSFYKAFQTGPNGYFYAELKGFKMVHSLLDHPLQSCRVRLVSSAQENCNVLTNVNYGLDGAPLRYENKRLVGSQYEAVVYAAGPLAFHPAHCVPKTPS